MIWIWNVLHDLSKVFITVLPGSITAAGSVLTFKSWE